MFSPEVEARFKKIEEDLIVSAEILRRFEIEGKERIGRLEAIQDAMARWLDEITDKMDAITDAHARVEDSLNRLSETVDRFLKVRTNGSEN